MSLLIYGLQRSGTNILRAQIERNYRVHFLNAAGDRALPLQKHCRFYDNKQKIPTPEFRNNIVVRSFAEFEALFEIVPAYYLVISKDPYSWYVSYKRWVKYCKWPIVNHHYIEEYNLFYGKFLELSRETERILFVRYVDLLSDAGALLGELQGKMNLRKRVFAKMLSKWPVRVPGPSRFTSRKKASFLRKEYLSDFEIGEIRELQNRVDWEVVSRLGYQVAP